MNEVHRNLIQPEPGRRLPDSDYDHEEALQAWEDVDKNEGPPKIDEDTDRVVEDEKE